MAPEEVEGTLASRHRMLAPRPPGPSSSSAILPSTAETDVGSTNDEAGGGRPVKRRRVACQHCRQSKLRCGGSNGGTQTCERCSELRQPCVFDAEYKRVSKRTTLNDLANHVELLKAASGLSRQETGLPTSDLRRPGQTTSPVSQASQTSSRSAPVVSASLAQEESQNPFEGRPIDSPNNVPNADISANPRLHFSDPVPLSRGSLSILTPVTSRSIEAIRLSPDQVKQFFETYYASYHPAFPVLPIPVSADSVYESSPLLFWTIIVTASRHDSVDFSLQQTLIPVVKKLLWSTISVVPHTLPSLQAMSILCVWTFPISSMPMDITFLLSGILKSAAMHVGLHRPNRLTLYSRTRLPLGSTELLQAAKVWCCIYIAIEGVAVGNGHQPFVPHDRTIERASAESNPYKLSESLHAAVITQTFCNRMHLAIGDPDEIEGLAPGSCRGPGISAFESDLRALETRLSKYQSHRTSVYLLSASFQLRAYSLFDDEDSVSREEGVLKAFDTAMEYIDALERGEGTGSPAKYLTSLDLRICFVAAVFISKVVHSSYCHSVDEDLSKIAFSRCIQIFKQSSVEDNDMNGRTTKLLAQLWGIHHSQYEASPQSPPRLFLTSRWFFSIAHDALWQWREKYAGQPSNGAPNLPPPVISPQSTDGLAETTVANYVDQATSTSTIGARPTESIAQVSIPPAFSESEQFSQAGNPIGDSTLEPWVTTCGQNNPTTEAGFNPDMPFDLLFSDLIMPYSDQNWL